MQYSITPQNTYCPTSSYIFHHLCCGLIDPVCGCYTVSDHPPLHNLSNTLVYHSASLQDMIERDGKCMIKPILKRKSIKCIRTTIHTAFMGQAFLRSGRSFSRVIQQSITPLKLNYPITSYIVYQIILWSDRSYLLVLNCLMSSLTT